MYPMCACSSPMWNCRGPCAGPCINQIPEGSHLAIWVSDHSHEQGVVFWYLGALGALVRPPGVLCALVRPPGVLCALVRPPAPRMHMHRPSPGPGRASACTTAAEGALTGAGVPVQRFPRGFDPRGRACTRRENSLFEGTIKRQLKDN